MEIIINLKYVNRDEIRELEDYLEDNCWDWKTKESEGLK